MNFHVSLHKACIYIFLKIIKVEENLSCDTTIIGVVYEILYEVDAAWYDLPKKDREVADVWCQLLLPLCNQ
jgi:hypothetical protein